MIVTLEQIIDIRKKLRSENKKVVFTNGCFDILHAGHIDYLSKSKKLGDILIVGVNSDSSIKRIKGDKRPIMNEVDRAFILSNLKPVDYVILFDENTPAEIINQIIPDILVKGADWEIAKIIGREIVEKNGGEVKTITFVNDVSTSKVIDIILKRYTH